MKKYDCSRTLDYVHERDRMCRHNKCDESCPLVRRSDECNPGAITQEHIDIVQRWSDEHPEPKLTREEYAFLQAFRLTIDKHIKREAGCVRLMVINTTPGLRPSMFRFITEGETWSLGDLLKLEVEGWTGSSERNGGPDDAAGTA